MDSEDSHSAGETPVLIPNTEVKPFTSVVVVSVKRQTKDAVFDFFFKKSFKCMSTVSLMKELSKNEVKREIEDYFSKEKLDQNKTRKIKNLAMKFRISLKDYRKKFCKKCYSDLSIGIVRISKTYKQVICIKCKMKNRWAIK